MSVWGWLRTNGAAVATEKKIEDQGKRDEGEGEEQRAALAMHPGVDHVRSDLDAELPDHEHAKSVSHEGDGQHDQGEGGLGPGRAQEHPAGDQAGEEEGERGADAAALRRLADAQPTGRGDIFAEIELPGGFASVRLARGLLLDSEMRHSAERISGVTAAELIAVN